ncbi:MAG: hypothetical protein K2Q09_00640, partial [Phycisphaerales bacterium]|nr:hypothetical protein [Phycisphaerales bacterium]
YGLEVGFSGESEFLGIIEQAMGAEMKGAWGALLKNEGVSGEPNITSVSYIAMTIGLLRRLGVPVTGDPPRDIRVAPKMLAGFSMAMEADASSATYPAAAAVLIDGSRVDLRGVGGLNAESLQGDAEFLSAVCLNSTEGGRAGSAGGSMVFGVGPVRGVSHDMRNMPDAAMTMAVVNAFAEHPTELRGLKTLRVKETDRIAALVTELAKVGVRIEPFTYPNDAGHPDEGVRVTPPPGGIRCSPAAPRVEFDTYNDHRMAMSLALIGLRRPNVYVRDPGCVRKTYPTFWRDLAKAYG